MSTIILTTCVSLRTTLSVRFKSEVVACGVVYAAARRFNVSLPESPPWWKVFDADKSDIEEVCNVLANLYKKPKASYIEVSKDSKSFVLSSRAWEPSASVKVGFESHLFICSFCLKRFWTESSGTFLLCRILLEVLLLQMELNRAR